MDLALSSEWLSVKGLGRKTSIFFPGARLGAGWARVANALLLCLGLPESSLEVMRPGKVDLRISGREFSDEGRKRLEYAEVVRSVSSNTNFLWTEHHTERVVAISIIADNELLEDGAFMTNMNYIQYWISSCKRIDGRPFSRCEDGDTKIEVEIKAVEV